MRLRVPGSAEPTYPAPDLALRTAGSRWLERIDPVRLHSLVAGLPAPRNRMDARAAMEATDTLLQDSWRASGWRIGRQRVAGGGRNVVAIREGATRDAVVVVAHHDTVPGSPGADDNGAGVAALIMLASLLEGPRRRTVILAAPDFEEIGLIGSRALVRWLRSAYDVRGAIVFDPIGYMDARPGTQSVPPGIDRLYPDQVARLDARGRAGDTVVSLYRHSSLELVRTWASCLAAVLDPDRILLLRDPVDLPVIGRALLAVPMARHFSRSDHVRFWDAGLPAIQVTNTANFRNPNYHRTTDTPETLDYRTLAAITAATALAVDRLAG